MREWFRPQDELQSVNQCGDFRVCRQIAPCVDRGEGVVNSEHLDENISDASPKQLAKYEEAYRVRLATDKLVHTVWVGVTKSGSIDCVTKVPTGPRALQSFASTGSKEKSRATIKEAAIGVGPTV